MSKILVFDTETIGLQDLSIFDIGFSLIDTEKETIESKAYLIDETYNSPVINKAYYYPDNKEFYDKLLEEKKTSIITINDLRKIFRDYLVDTKIDVLAAFNINFDIRALNYTVGKVRTNGKQITLSTLSKVVKLFDIGIGFAEIEKSKQCYECWCRRNKYVTAANNIKTDVQTIIGFIKNNKDLKEAHTGMDDSIMESDILMYSLIKSGNEEDFIKRIHTLTMENKKPYLIFKNGR